MKVSAPKIVLAILLVMFLSSCANSVKIKDTWRSTEAPAAVYNKLLVVADTRNSSLREMLENITVEILAVRRAGGRVLFAPAYEGPLFGRVPLDVSVHDVSFFAHPEWFARREGTRRRVLTRGSARRARAVLTLTEFSRREIVRHLGVDEGKVRVIPPAVDAHPCFGLPPARADSASAPRAPLVLYAGSLFNRRHVPELIAGFARIAHERAAARLELVGANRTRPYLDVATAAREQRLTGFPALKR